jgi:hypothetical protein
MNTPYKVENNGDGDIWISDAQDNVVVESFGDLFNVEGTAKDIVLACNSHDELLEACKFALTTLREFYSVKEHGVMQTLINAIKKAEGKS